MQFQNFDDAMDTAFETGKHIIIFYEAHNVEKMCEESSSIELRSLDIAPICVDEVMQVLCLLPLNNLLFHLSFFRRSWKHFEKTMMMGL